MENGLLHETGLQFDVNGTVWLKLVFRNYFQFHNVSHSHVMVTDTCNFILAMTRKDPLRCKKALQCAVYLLLPLIFNPRDIRTWGPTTYFLIENEFCPLNNICMLTVSALQPAAHNCTKDNPFSTMTNAYSRPSYTTGVDLCIHGSPNIRWIRKTFWQTVAGFSWM